MDTGQFFSGTIYTPAAGSRPRTHTAKGLCIRIGENNEAAVCYDTELLRMSAGWTGPFLAIDPARYGIISPPQIAGDVLFTTAVIPGWANRGSFEDPRPHKPFGTLPKEHAHYRGFYFNGRRLVLSYTVGGAEIQESPWFETVDGVPIITRTIEVTGNAEPLELAICDRDGVAAVAGISTAVSLRQLESGRTVAKIAAGSTSKRFVFAIAASSKTDASHLAELSKQLKASPKLESLSQPGPERWTAEIMTQGKTDEQRGDLFAVDTLTLPFDNPYRALFFVSGHDFFSNNVAAICTVHGDVWLVSGIDDRLNQLKWKRFATGLFQPLGLKMVRDTVYVVGRDQITRLHDRDGNGEADWYENFNNDGHVSTNGHEYVTCLETDPDGNFYFLKGDSGGKHQHDGCLLRVSADGNKLDVFATGFRNANGMGMSPRGEITVSPQEGEWTPASGIFAIQPGGFHGAMSVHHQPTRPTDYVKPVCWLPRRIDNSSGGQVWVPEGMWGQLGGEMLHFSYGQCSAMLAFRQQISGGAQQGGIIPLPLSFRSGVMRGRFHPREPALYVSGLRGWVSNAIDDGCFQRVRYVGNERSAPTALGVNVYKNGLLVRFSGPLDKPAAEDPDNYQAEQWNYRWSEQYGSPELKPSESNVEGRDRIAIQSATLLQSRKEVFLEIPDLKPVSVLQLDCAVRSATGLELSPRLWCTIHSVDFPEAADEYLAGRRSSQVADRSRSALKPGLLFRFSQSGPGTRDSSAERHHTTRHRLASLHVPARVAATPFFKPGPFRVVIDGYLRAPELAKYKFHPIGNGTAKVYLNNELIGGFGAEVTPAMQTKWRDILHDVRGLVPIRVEYRHDHPSAGATFQLRWEREGGWEEPVPPTAFSYLGDDSGWADSFRRERAADLVIQNRCVKCHPSALDVAGNLASVTANGPSLKLAGDRLNPQWVQAWLKNPHQLRSDATMPSLLHDENSDPESVRTKALHLSAFLNSLRSSPQSIDESNATEGDHQLGGRLWEELGCIGCHRLNADKEDEYSRTSLQFVLNKYRPASLVRYLQSPHADYEATRMPDFQLSAEESRALAAYLRQQIVPAAMIDESQDGGSVQEGRKLAESLRCQACHDFGTALGSGQGTVTELQIPIKKFDLGCLAAESVEPKHAPRFHLDEASRRQLSATLAAAELTNWNISPSHESERLFKMLRCGVCHGRDQESSQLPTILAEEGERGWLPEALPNLTWVGERLQSEWLQLFIGGGITGRPRPHLQTRMPSFPSYARTLAEGIALQHGIGTDDSTDRRPPLSLNDLSVGYRLTTKDGGLDCRQCHAVGSQPAQGDDKTRLAPGINFALISKRMRYDFYSRFVLDPPRYDINTRMPRLSADGRTTSVHEIYHGDARRQFDSIWNYMQTIHSSEP